MECINCRYQMIRLGCQATWRCPGTWYCSRCGTLSIGGETTAPALVRRCRKLAREFAGHPLADTLERHGIVESIFSNPQEALSCT